MLYWQWRQTLRNFDWPLLVGVFILTAISLAAVYSVDLSRGEILIFSPTQITALLIGLAFLFGASFFHISFYRASAKVIYLSSVILLIGVLVFGDTIRGTTGWFRMGGFSFQPSEFAKIGLIIFLAWWIERYGRRFDKWQFVLTSGFFTVLLAGLILLQPDFGSALILGAIWFGLLILVGIKKRYLFGLVGIVLIVFTLSWFFFFASYQKERILTFINPERDPLGAGYNVTQSIIAIGSGGVFGRGLGFGSQSQLHFLPEAQTDFIFSVIAEELGFVGAAVVVLVFFFILWRLVLIARQASDDFTAYLVLGILLLFISQIIVNLGAAMGFLPVAGVTLPFLSYGGSSLIINLFLIGVVESAAKSKQITG